ncbi:FAD-dependent oxidoreductase [Alphaproteobacteria bacterium]|jgi:NADPH-dependent glutamate synthase beta subunit-like oxidoreductase|nr:FAD-dependent oxidoreductase [Alphaproteobacteria bacterium]
MGIKIAIIGSGPAAFYTAQSLLKEDIEYEIDIIEKLFSPYGLVRYGVSPDHQSTKNVSRVFERTLSNTNVEFFGGIEINNSPSIKDILALYDAVVIATGMAKDRDLNINNTNISGYFGATQFVNWYNGHPEYKNLSPDLSGDTAIIIGNGNVAIDCARLLVSSNQELEGTDITNYAKVALLNSGIKKVYIIGRRGPLDAKFTTVEIREMSELLDCDQVLSKGTLQSMSKAILEDEIAKQYRILASFPEAKQRNSNKTKTVEFKFYLSPINILGTDRITDVEFRDNLNKNNKTITIKANLIISAIGYEGEEIEGVPTDSTGKIINNENIVKDRLYTVGWVSRGPTGVIGTNKQGGAKVAKLITNNIKPRNSPGRNGLKLLLSKLNKRYISKEQWFLINDEEINRASNSSPRLKFTSFTDVFNFLDNI